METSEGPPSWRPMKLDEDAHFFDFIAFYKKVEFCDRSIRLEILEECRKVHITGGDEDTEMVAGELVENRGKSAAVAPEDEGKASVEAANPLEEAGEGSGKASETRYGDSEEVREKAQEAEVQQDKEKGDEEPSGEEEPGSDSSEEQSGEKERPSENSEEAPGNLEKAPGESEKGPAFSKNEETWVEEIPVNSIVLAAKSCVLRTMLSNGMKESDKSAPVVLKVTPDEKLAFKELLHFVYVGSLSPAFLQPDASVRALVDLLIVGDKFEVGSLMGAALTALAKRERTVSDDVVLALEIPDALEQYPEVKAVVTKARTRVVETFKDVDTWSASLIFLTLGIEVVSFLLQSEELEAASEEQIFEGVLVWVKNNRTGRAAQREAMRQLSQHIRFGCMKGEYLIKSVFPLSEMALWETQERVRSGIYFQACSDNVKLKTKDLFAQPRKGIQGRGLEICCNFTLDEAGAGRNSPKAVWMGKQWSILVYKDCRHDPPTVGLFVVPSKASDEDVETTAIKCEFRFSVRVWPTGYWKTLKAFSPILTTAESGRGFSDALESSWEDVRKSEYYIGSTGEITIQATVRLKKDVT